MKPADKYLKTVEWPEEDSCYIGTCPGLIHGGIHGDNEAKVYEELCLVVAEAVELYQTDGRPLPAATANNRPRQEVAKTDQNIGQNHCGLKIKSKKPEPQRSLLQNDCHPGRFLSGIQIFGLLRNEFLYLW